MHVERIVVDDDRFCMTNVSPGYLCIGILSSLLLIYIMYIFKFMYISNNFIILQFNLSVLAYTQISPYLCI